MTSSTTSSAKLITRSRILTAAGAVGALLAGAGFATAAVSAASPDSPAAVTAQASTDDTATTVAGDADTDTERDCDRGEHGRGGHHDGDGGGDGQRDGQREDEVELTGDVADQVTAAAEAAVPGGTVERVESDGDGATYEAHVVDADGNEVTVTFDDAFAVVEIVQGR